MKKIDKEEVAYLENIYRFVKMYQENIMLIIKESKTEDDFLLFLLEILNENKKICRNIKLMLKRRNKEVKDIGVISKITTMINVKTSKIDDINQIKEILKQTCTMNIKELEKLEESYSLSNKKLLNVCEKMISIEKRIVDKIENNIM